MVYLEGHVRNLPLKIKYNYAYLRFGFHSIVVKFHSAKFYEFWRMTLTQQRRDDVCHSG